MLLASPTGARGSGAVASTATYRQIRPYEGGAARRPQKGPRQRATARIPRAARKDRRGRAYRTMGTDRCRAVAGEDGRADKENTDEGEESRRRNRLRGSGGGHAAAGRACGFDLMMKWSMTKLVRDIRDPCATEEFRALVMGHGSPRAKRMSPGSSASQALSMCLSWRRLRVIMSVAATRRWTEGPAGVDAIDRGLGLRGDCGLAAQEGVWFAHLEMAGGRSRPCAKAASV
jgi:hypothetical protein